MLDILKIISHPIKYQIIVLLIEGNRCGCTMINQLPISQPTLSHHLKSIEACGLAKSIREGNQIHYIIQMDVLNQAIAFLNAMKNDTLPQVQRCN